MSDQTTFRLAEELMSSFGQRLVLDTMEIREILEGEEELVSRCLDFLVARDRLLIAAGRSPLFYHKDNVIKAIVAELGSGQSMKAEELAGNLSLPIATTCEVLGWLERERRVVVEQVGEDVHFIGR
ncbi:MAG: hypothetical protein ACI97A_002449 [Planctomycetota bacterium]|jgi:hypothetical protein